MDTKNKYFLLGFIAGLLTTLYIGSRLHQIPNLANTVPNIGQVQEGFVAPNDLEIKCKDVDGNGQLETYLHVRGQDYPLTWSNLKDVLIKRW